MGGEHAAVNVNSITRHILIGTSDTQEMGLNWDKGTGVFVPCCQGVEVSRHVWRSMFAALLRRIQKRWENMKRSKRQLMGGH